MKSPDFYRKYEDYKNYQYEKYMEDSVQKGMWQYVDGFPKFQHYIFNIDGLYNVMRVNK